jgi:hypothetical protein
VAVESTRDEPSARRRADLLDRIRRLTDEAAVHPAELRSLTSTLDSLITALEPLDPALSDVLRQEWWRLEMLNVGWVRRVPFVSRRLLDTRLRRLRTIARVG